MGTPTPTSKEDHSVARAARTSLVALIGLQDAAHRQRLGQSLSGHGFAAWETGNGIELLELVAEAMARFPGMNSPALIIAEQQLPGRRGIDLLADLRQLGVTIPFVLVAPQGETHQLALAQWLGAALVIPLPGDTTMVELALGQLFGELPLSRASARRKERRASSRVAADLLIEELAFQPLYLRCPGNISLGGMYLSYPSRHAPGDVIRVRFKLPDDRSSFEVSSRVASVHSSPSSEGFGLHFLDLGGADRQRLGSFINGAQP